MGFTIRDSDESSNTNQSIWMQTDINAMVDGIDNDGVISGCLVQQSASPGMSVNIGSGVVQIGGQRTDIAGGGLLISNADSSYHRLDVIYASNAGAIGVVSGTPTQYPKAKDYPAGSVLLAIVFVPAQGTQIVDPYITDKRLFVHPINVGTRLTTGANASIPNNTWTALPFDTEVKDTDAFHESGTPTQITIPMDGSYRVGVSLSFATDGSGVRGVRVSVNGTYILYDIQTPQSADPTYFNLTTDIDLTAADVLTVEVYQTSGGALDVLKSGDFSPIATVRRAI